MFRTCFSCICVSHKTHIWFTVYLTFESKKKTFSVCYLKKTYACNTTKSLDKVFALGKMCRVYFRLYVRSSCYCKQDVRAEKVVGP